MKPQNDVLKVQVKLNESELSLRKADNALRLAGMNLCHYIGRPLTAQISGFDWNFSPTHTSSPPFSTDVRSVLHFLLRKLQPGHG